MPDERPKIAIGDFLTREQVEACIRIYESTPDYDRAKRIREEVLKPKWAEIDAKIAAKGGQLGNDIDYWAYVICYVCDQAPRMPTPNGDTSSTWGRLDIGGGPN